MSMTIEEARVAIIERMRLFKGISQECIAYPNLSFNPPENGLWCRLTIAGGSSFIAGIADKPCTRRTGNIMIQCFDRLHTGEKAITELSDALLAHFEYFTIEHLECLQGQAINAGKDSDFIQYNVSIGYKVN